MEQPVIEVTKEEKIVEDFLVKQIDFEKELFAQLDKQTKDNFSCGLCEYKESIAMRIAYLEELLLRKRNGF